MSDLLSRWTQEGLEFLAGLGFQKWTLGFLLYGAFLSPSATEPAVLCSASLGDRKSWVEVQALLRTGYVSLGYVFHLSEPLFHHL